MDELTVVPFSSAERCEMRQTKGKSHYVHNLMNKRELVPFRVAVAVQETPMRPTDQLKIGL